MDEQKRLLELLDYKILDTPPEKDLDELAEIASAICDTPMSLLTFIDDKRQWFKAVKGMSDKETLRQDSFCQHTLNKPKDVLVVEDPLNDERFRNNPYVLGSPHIRFYAGAPLETARGHVLGTLCIIDSKPHEISGNQRKALQLLAKKAMEYLNTRKLLIEQGEKIESNAKLLKNLTDQAPGTIFQFEMSPEGHIAFPFVSEGISRLHARLTPEVVKRQPEKVFDVIHEDDQAKVHSSIRDALTTLVPWNVEFRVRAANGTVAWYWVNARPERKDNGTVVMYGTFQDITDRKEYEEALEQMTFDISHVLRRPVTTMLGLTSMIEKETLDEGLLRQYMGHLKSVSAEMDSFTRKLNAVYGEKRDRMNRSVTGNP
jgi:hypothetical protein